MGRTLQELTQGQVPRTVDDLDALYKKIEKLGRWGWNPIEKIKKKVSSEVFTVYLGMDMITKYQAGGWFYVLTPDGSIVPYISDALTQLELHEIEEIFCQRYSILPELADYTETECIHEPMNVLMFGEDYVPTDKRLRHYSKEERLRITKEFAEVIKQLDAQSDKVWGKEAPGEGFAVILRYIEKHLNY